MQKNHTSIVPTEGPMGALVSNIGSMLQQEMAIKDIPATSVSINVEGKTVYMESFGYEDKEKTRLVTENTVFRVGSITKLFTDLALVIAAEAGLVDLDAPVMKYVEDFAPRNEYAVAINSRHLMAHTSGLAREPPRGHYFDDSADITLEATVRSLNSTSVMYEPGTTQKYSNAAIAVVGRILERVYAKPWAQLMRELLLEPLGMECSDFEWTERVKPHLTRATMWTPDFRLDRDPPHFQLGEAPAGSLYSTVSDMNKFAQMILRRGALPNGRQLLKSDWFDSDIFRTQFPLANRKGSNFSFGIGWQLINIAGVNVAAHGGAVYGFTGRLVVSTELNFSLVLLTSGDGAITTVKHATNYIIEHLGKLLRNQATEFPLKTLYDVSLAQMLQIEGAYMETGDGQTHLGYGDRKFKRMLHFDQRYGKLMLKHDSGYSRVMLSKKAITTSSSASNAVSLEKDGASTTSQQASAAAADGFSFEVLDRFEDHELLVMSSDMSRITWGDAEYERIQGQEPMPAVYPEYDRFIGEFGPNHAPVCVFERYGRLFALLEWVMQYPLRRAENDDAPLSTDAAKEFGNSKREVWLLPSEDCFYADEKLIFFDYDEHGVPNALECTGMVFERRLRGVANDATFKVDVQAPIEQLREIALNSAPPAHLTVGRRQPDLVDMSTLKPNKPFVFDIKYATEDNFMGVPFYKLPKAFAQRPAAINIEKAHHWLNQHGFGLVLFDIYRPWHVTKMFWDATPPKLRHFVANPETGSIHNRGGAIDCGLYDLATGKQMVMVGGFDEMTPRSYRDYPGGTTKQRWLQVLLRTAMQQFEFEVYEYEWWHFNFATQQDYPVLNVAFEDM